MTEQTRSLTPAELKNLKVMILDPNSYMRGVISDSLRRMQVVNITPAASAAEAYSHGRNFKPDIIFVDWDAGRTNGLEFTREVRRNTTGLPRETPIILLAGAIDHEQLMGARQAGVNEFLLKPISARGLMSRMDEVILRPRKFVVSRNYIGPCRRRRQDPDYSGPWRRLTDEPKRVEAAKTSQQNINRLHEIIRKLWTYSEQPANDDPEDRAAGIRGMYRMLSEHHEEVRHLTDETIGRVWESAIRYIEGVGMTDSYDVEVIRYHFQTIRRIIEMPEEALIHRSAVAAELERLVTKKINNVGDASLNNVA
ncbi:MAG: response regulator [Hyphomonadaceae bacterium]